MRNWFAEKAGLVTAVVVLVLFAVGLVGLLTQPGARAAGLPSGATPYERETELLALTGGINTNNGLAAATTNSTQTAVIDVSKDKEIMVAVQQVLEMAGTATTQLKFKRGFKTPANSNYFESTPSITLTFAPSGATTNVVMTNLVVCGSVGVNAANSTPLLGLASVGNGNTSAVSALEIWIGRIPVRRDSPY